MAIIPFDPTGGGSGIDKVGDGLEIISGIASVKPSVDFKFNAASRALELNPNAIDINLFKNADTFSSGVYKDGLNASSTLATLANSVKGEWWNVAAQVTISGTVFNVGDQLWCRANTVGTPANLNNFVRVPSTMGQATNTATGAIKLAGDLSGTAESPIVSKVKGINYPGNAGIAGEFMVSTGSAFDKRKLVLADVPPLPIGQAMARRRSRDFQVPNMSDTDIPFDLDWTIASTFSDMFLDIMNGGVEFRNRDTNTHVYQVSYTVIYPRAGDNANTCQWKAWIEPYANAGLRVAQSNEWRSSASVDGGDRKLTGSATIVLPPNAQFKIRTYHNAGAGVMLGGGYEGCSADYSTTLQIVLLR